MAGTQNALSPSITNFDAAPTVAVNTGAGAGSRLHTIDDIVSMTTTITGNATSYARIVRFPTEAIVKKVIISESTELDTHSADQLVMDFNVAFSDSTTDGTPAALQGTIPTTALTGAVTTFAAYSSPNLLWGQYTPTYNAIFRNVDITFNGSFSTYSFKTLVMQPLWLTFGFTNAYGVSGDPGGFFDLTVYVSTAAGTSALGDLYARVEYSIP